MFDSFFILPPYPLLTESGTYSPLLVLLSYIIAAIGSYTALNLAFQLTKAKDPHTRILMHMGGAIALGTGIWAMHFIGMLSYKMKMVHSYDPLMTFFSMVIAVGAAYVVFGITRTATLSHKRLIAGSFVLGISICGMHYLGMEAMVMDADLKYIPWIFFLSLAVAVIASGVALCVFFKLGKCESRHAKLLSILAALVLGLAITVMHYIGMAATVFCTFCQLPA